MTNIRTIDDIIDVIQTDQEVRRRMVAALNVSSTETQGKVLASVDRLTQNVDNLTRTVSDQGKNIDNLAKTVGDQGKSIDNLTRTVGDQGKNIDNLTRAVGDQGKNIDNLAKNVENLTKMVGDQGKSIDNLTRTVGDQGKNIDNLTDIVGDLAARVLGNDTEDRAVDKIISDLGVLFRGVRGTRLMYAHHGRLGFNDDYGQIVQAARENNEIEHTDYRRLVSTDIVFSARREGRIHIFPAEVSNTLATRDVDQAVRSSRLISQVFRNKVGPVTGTEYGDLAVQPLVAGVIVPDPVQDHADSLDVEVVTVNVPTMHSELESQS